MDVSGAFGPFLRHNGTSPICTNGGVVQFDVLHPDRILLPNGLDAGTYFITFYLEPNHGYSIVHAQQDANYGANSTFQNEFGLIDHNGALKSSAIPSQEQVSFSGPNLKIGAGATELVTPHGEPTMTRTVEITGTNVTVPSGKIIFKDKHSFAASGLDDPISIVRIHYGALDIYPIPNDGVEGEEWFVIDQVTHAALYNDVLAGSAVVQEVIEISALCTRNRPTDGITSELTIGWNCNGDPTLPFDDSYSATGRKIKPDILKPDIVPEYVSKALPDCYYTPNGYTTLELRIINQGDLVGRLRTFGLNWENYWFTPGSNMGRIEISTDAPMEISRPYYYLTDPPDWSDQITITNPDAAQYNGAIVRTGSSCGSADLESLM
ncbi:MAG TPA: hypothetical protein VKG92_12035, partial [Flavobacteriales bacterium]|nr:hypothetical protein [Flavobacteriales bacterium]